MRKPVVERLVRDGDAVMVVEFAQQVREGVDVAAAERSDGGEKQPVGLLRQHRQGASVSRTGPDDDRCKILPM